MEKGHRISNLMLKVEVENYSSVENYLNKHVPCVDDLVFNTKDGKPFHLDFEEISHSIQEVDSGKNKAVLQINLKSPGVNWDELNKDEGLLPDDITFELLKDSKLDNYIIFIEDENSEIYDNFKIGAMAYYDGNEIKELSVPEEAYNSTDETID